MKNTAIILSLLFLFPLYNMAQDKDVKKLFSHYKNKPGFEMEVEDPDFDMDADSDFDFLNFLDEVETIYILNFEPEEGNENDYRSFSSKLEKLIVKKDYKTMIDISGEGSVRILTKKDGEETTDILMITKDNDGGMFFYASRD